jgi:hypothetical protein
MSGIHAFVDLKLPVLGQSWSGFAALDPLIPSTLNAYLVGIYGTFVF